MTGRLKPTTRERETAQQEPTGGVRMCDARYVMRDGSTNRLMPTTDNVALERVSTCDFATPSTTCKHCRPVATYSTTHLEPPQNRCIDISSTYQLLSTHLVHATFIYPLRHKTRGTTYPTPHRPHRPHLPRHLHTIYCTYNV